MTTAQLPRSVWLPVLALAMVVFGWRINTVPLTNWDEGIYANVNLELFRSHDWSKLTYFGADFLEKPALQFWASSWLFGVFGPTELAVRLIPALAGIGTALLLALWAWQATHKRSVAVLAGGLFVLGRFTLIHAFRTGDLDGLLTFFITLAMYGYWRAVAPSGDGFGSRAPRWIVAWGVASAGAVMTKSLAGLLPLIIVALDLVLSRGWRKVGWGNLAWAGLAFVVLAAPWHIVEALRFGQAFWHSYLGRQVVDRATDSLFTPTPWHWYFQIIRDRWFPFSFLLPLALVTALWQAWKKDDTARLLIVWLVVTLTIFSFIHTRREWYILPLYPAAVLLLVQAVMGWWQKRPRPWIQVALTISLAGAFGHLLTDGQTRLVLQHFPLLRQLTNVSWSTVTGQALFGVAVLVVIALAAVLLQRWRGTWWKWMLGASGGALVLFSLGWTTQYLRSQPTTLPLKTIAARIEQEHVQNVSLVGTRLKKQPAGYFYILRMGTHSVEYPAGTPPPTPLVVTTNEAVNSPLNTEGKKLVDIPPLLLIDLR